MPQSPDFTGQHRTASPEDGSTAGPGSRSGIDLSATRAAVASNAAVNRASAGAYQEATCPICGRRFMVKRTGQMFDRDACRSRYNRLNRSVTEVENVVELQRTREELERARADLADRTEELRMLRWELQCERFGTTDLRQLLHRTETELTATRSLLHLLQEGPPRESAHDIDPHDLDAAPASQHRG
jgi:hypothetical protein